MADQIADVIVLIPGITGSVLTKHKKTVWAPQAGAAARAFFSGADSIRSLELDGDDPEIDDLGDGVEATGLVQDLHLIPRLVKIDGYTALRRALFERLRLAAGENYFEFPYDWRRDNRVAARKLGIKVEQWLKRRRQSHPSAKVVLVAHSMGGIIGRIYLEMMEGWRNTRRLVTFGTPYSGSLTALDSIANGFSVGKWFLKTDLSETLRSFTSVYQLLPSYRCFLNSETSEWVYLDKVDGGLPNCDPGRLADAMDLHRAIRAAVDANRAGNYEGSGGYDLRPLIGDWQDTKYSARLDDGVVTFSQAREPDETGGDGTVPTVSAIPHEYLESRTNVVFVNEKHGSLQNNPFSSDNLASLLHMVVAAPVFPAPDALLAVEAEDAAEGEPVTVRAKASVPDRSLACRIQELATGAVKTVPMAKDPHDDHRATLTIPPLPEGDYRVTVSGPGVNPVTDLFSVVKIDG
jgi:Lecithin:cholesterol acyltransferase